MLYAKFGDFAGQRKVSHKKEAQDMELLSAYATSNKLIIVRAVINKEDVAKAIIDFVME